MTDKTDINRDIFYPPGGILIWLVIIIELITFGIALLTMAYFSQSEADAFHDSRLQLNSTLGMINTLVLLTSGYFMAVALEQIKANQLGRGQKNMLITIFMGLIFLMIKSFEYSEKLEAGFTIGFNTFFSFYWMITLFHVVHVLVGLVILFFLYIRLHRCTWLDSPEDFEGGAAFWHMCDLLWLLIFPVIYLIF